MKNQNLKDKPKSGLENEKAQRKSTLSHPPFKIRSAQKAGQDCLKAGEGQPKKRGCIKIFPTPCEKMLNITSKAQALTGCHKNILVPFHCVPFIAQKYILWQGLTRDIFWRASLRSLYTPNRIFSHFPAPPLLNNPATAKATTKHNQQ